jgi:uncharacterized protein YycO
MSKGPEIDYKAIQPMDAVLTASRGLAFGAIRFRASWNPLDLFRMKIPNHAGLVVKMENRLWIVEALKDGIRINSLETYRNNYSQERILFVKRHPKFDDELIRSKANDFCIDVAMRPPKYDYAGILEFLNICKDNPNEYYCSEFCEVVANKYSISFGDFQLVRNRGKKARISPDDLRKSAFTRFVKWYI